jgi:hypothetical protein
MQAGSPPASLQVVVLLLMHVSPPLQRRVANPYNLLIVTSSLGHQSSRDLLQLVETGN